MRRASGDIGFSPCERSLDERVVRVRDPEVDAALEALREHDPSASSARNLAGTVRRFFASSE